MRAVSRKPQIEARAAIPKKSAAPPKQLQIINLRWRTIELKGKQGVKGREFEDASARYISKL